MCQPCLQVTQTSEITTKPLSCTNADPNSSSVTPQHAIDQITERPPVVLPAGQLMFIDEQDVVLEAGVQMWLETEVHYDRIVVAVDMGVDTVQALEDLAEETGE